MDHRLLLAIDRVIGDGDFAFEAGLVTRAGPDVREQLLSAAEQMSSGTGTPNSELKGAAKNSGMKAALGKGPKYAGGEGMAGGEKLLDRSGLQLTLLTLGVTGTATIARIGLEYWAICAAEKKEARKAVAAPTSNTVVRRQLPPEE